MVATSVASGPELLCPGPIEAAFMMAVDGLEDFSRAGLLDEETLTASFLGGLRVAVPAAARIYGSGITDKTRRCSWGAYKKSARATNEKSEAASGADFSLVVWESETHARLGIFQAKKADHEGPENTVDIHRSPKPPSQRRPQLVMLASTGMRFLKVMSRLRERHPAHDVDPAATVAALLRSIPDRAAFVEMLTDASPEDRFKLFGQLGWIHYLVYRNGEPVCVSLTHLQQYAIEQEFVVGTRQTNSVDIGKEPRSLRSLLACGLSPDDPGDGWLRLDKHTLEALLPDLQELMPVHVADGRGGGLVNKADAEVEVVAQLSSSKQLADLHAVVSAAGDASEPSSSSGLTPRRRQ